MVELIPDKNWIKSPGIFGPIGGTGPFVVNVPAESSRRPCGAWSKRS